MDVNSLRFTPDWAGQTCVCSCCLGSCWGARLSKLPTCEVSWTKTLGYVKSHLYGQKEERKKIKIGITFLQYTHIKQLPKIQNYKNEMLYDMRPPQLLLPGQRWWGFVGRFSNKPADLLVWIRLRADCQQQVARAPATDSEQPLYYTQGHHWWAMEVEGLWWGTNIQMCSVGCTLTKSGSLRERERKKYFDTENMPINLGAKQPAYKSCAVFLHNNNNVSSRHLSEQWKDNPRGKKNQQHKIEHTLKEGRTRCCSRVLLRSAS